MKKLLIALAAAATAVVASAEIKNQLGFEGEGDGGTAYPAGDKQLIATANYPFASFGSKYLELDESYKPDAKGGNILDMYIQFVACDEAYGLEEGEKLGVYVDKTDGCLVVVGSTVTKTSKVVTEGWHRLTVVPSGTADFYVYVDGVKVQENAFAGAGANNSISEMEFKGSGKLDNFVARTTDPFGGAPANWVAKEAGASDPEQYYTDYTAALTAALNGASLSFNGGMNGTAEHPFEIRSEADLKALQAAVADGKGADKCYVQTVDITLTEAWPGIGIQNGKDICTTAAFDNGAFKGTYDGGNHTISGFQMVGVAGNPKNNGEGLDYCGFFNSTFGATIKNLKIQYAGALFAVDTTASTKESGATFVGVAKNSTLQNLTSLEGTVSCSKGFGGIVGYLMAGSTVDSCTNNVNLTSTASNKAGGIAMITQGGSGTATIRNCQNNGTTAGNASQKGGIVGYVGVATTIADCEDTAGSDPSFLHHQTGTLTMTGVNKAPAGVKSYTKNTTNIDGLNLATVDNGVATFVKSADLVLGNTYKVMGPGAAYAFAQAGTISFDQALATPAVTAAEGLVLTTSTSGTVTTYTAAAAVAKIGDTKYTSLAAALADAAGKTVTLAADITLTGAKDAIEFPANALTLDLNGYTIGRFANSYYVLDIPNGADVTIKDTSVAGTGMVKGTPVASGNTKNPASMIRLKGKLTLASGSLVSDYCCVKVDEDPGVGEFVMNGGSLEIIANDKGYTGLTFTIMNWGVATINGGTHKGNVQSLSYSGNNVSKTSTLTINGGSFDPANIYLLPYDTTYAPTVKIVSTIDNLTVVNAGKASLNWEVKNLADETVADKTYKVYSLSQIPQGFPGGAEGTTFNIDTAVQTALEAKLPEGTALTDAVAGMTSGMTYAQAYALGLLNEETGVVAKDVTPTIEIKDGKVVISLDTAAKDAYKVMLTVYESTSLEANAKWSVKDPYELGSEAEAAGFTPAAGGSGFYKVGVVIEDK